MLSKLLDMSDKILGVVDKLMNIFSKFSKGGKKTLKSEESNSAPVTAVDPVKDVASPSASNPERASSSSSKSKVSASKLKDALKPKQSSSTKYQSNPPKE